MDETEPSGDSHIEDESGELGEESNEPREHGLQWHKNERTELEEQVTLITRQYVVPLPTCVRVPQKKGHLEDLERAKKEIADLEKQLKEKDEIIDKLSKDPNPNATHVPPPPPEEPEESEEKDEM